MSKLNNSPKKHTMFNDTEIPKNYIPQHPLFEAAEPRSLNGCGTPLSDFFWRDDKGNLHIDIRYINSYLKGSVGFTQKLFSVNNRTKLDKCKLLMEEYVRLVTYYIKQAVRNKTAGYICIEQILGYTNVINLRIELSSSLN